MIRALPTGLVILSALCIIGAFHELSALTFGNPDAATWIGLAIDIVTVPISAWSFRRLVS